LTGRVDRLVGLTFIPDQFDFNLNLDFVGETRRVS
jgi:hypothetical protein